jgi:crotonobetainyl-CoA:carnitine CoA-transferase CaiB-like acyl-CoA transferase
VGIPCAPVNDVGQALEDPQVLHREMVQTVQHPSAGPIRLLGNPVKTTSRRRETLPPPLFGEHTRELLGALGLDESTLDELAERKVTVPVSRRVDGE